MVVSVIISEEVAGADCISVEDVSEEVEDDSLLLLLQLIKANITIIEKQSKGVIFLKYIQGDLDVIVQLNLIIKKNYKKNFYQTSCINFYSFSLYIRVPQNHGSNSSVRAPAFCDRKHFFFSDI